jgi:hypothetical protein
MSKRIPTACQSRTLDDGAMNNEEKKPVTGGATATEQGETQQRSPRQPNEHDESADSQSRGEASQKRMAEIGREDLESGRVDTDKGPVLRELHQKKI